MEELGINVGFLLVQLLALVLLVSLAVIPLVVIVGVWRRYRSIEYAEEKNLNMRAEVTTEGLFIPASLLPGVKTVEIRKRGENLLLVPVEKNKAKGETET